MASNLFYLKSKKSYSAGTSSKMDLVLVAQIVTQASSGGKEGG